MTVKTHTSHCIPHITTVKITVFTFFSVFYLSIFYYLENRKARKTIVLMCVWVCALRSLSS